MVLATQNPIEYEGTFPLPEAQVDRFLMRIQLGYPGSGDEIQILERQQYRHPFRRSYHRVVTEAELISAQEQVKNVYAAPLLKRYIVEIVQRNTRTRRGISGSQPARQFGALIELLRQELR